MWYEAQNIRIVSSGQIWLAVKSATSVPPPLASRSWTYPTNPVGSQAVEPATEPATEPPPGPVADGEPGGVESGATDGVGVGVGPGGPDRLTVGTGDGVVSTGAGVLVRVGMAIAMIKRRTARPASPAV
jgi:hypothetical protein